MEFNWIDSFELCKTLKASFIKDDFDKLEALVRMIVNRCYYSSFRLLSKHLKDKGIYEYDNKNPTKSSHEDIISNLKDFVATLEKSINKKRYKRIINYLIFLKIQRKRVDYNDISLNEPIIMLNDCINNAEKILYLINVIENNLPYNYEKEN